MSEQVTVIAGNGELPVKVLKNLKKRGIRADVIGITGEYNREIRQYSDRFETIRFYELERGIDILKKFGNRDVIFAGGVSKVGLLNMFRPETIKNLIKLNSLSDESIFIGIINLLNRTGFNVVHFSRFYEEGIAREGNICGITPDSLLIKDAIYGMNFIKHNSDFSTGQSVIVKNENIISLETVFGTDNMIKNYSRNSLADAVFVKCSKRGQDERIDLPSIGKKTIELLLKSGIKWVFLEAGRTVIIGDDATVSYAFKKGINIWGIRSE